MTNLTHDEIIQYGLNHEDETVRELAQRFQCYREAVLRTVNNMKPSAVGPFHNQLDYGIREPNVNHL